jgi:hypothetical protein
MSKRTQQLAQLEGIALDRRNQMKMRLAEDRRRATQLAQLEGIALDRRNQMKMRLAEDRRRATQLAEDQQIAQQLDELIRIAEARKEEMRTRNRRNSFRRRKSFEEYNANVPFLRRSNSRGNIDERIIYNEPLEVINVSPRNETTYERALNIARERERKNPTAPRTQTTKTSYVPRSSYGPNFAVRDNDAIKKHTQAKRDSAARIITKMMINKTRKRK